ncbi:MAG: TolC family protein [Bacteroidales bacterium]|nr:TolC family protein [Bacteroidales bacterium]
MKRVLVIIFVLIAATASSQELTLTLPQVIELAKDSSLTAFRYKNMYLASYWNFRTFKANRLPSLSLDIEPVVYNRQLVARYDSENDIDIYRQQKSYSASAGLTLTQNFDPLGGTFYVSTSLDYLRGFGDKTFNQYTAVPFIIGYRHNSFGYNQFKWDRKIEPMKFEKAKQEYLYNTELIAIQAVQYFFQLALSQAQYENAVAQKAKCDSLLIIGQMKFKIASITKSDLMTLQLDVLNAQNSIATAEVNVRRNMLRLTSFLGLDRNIKLSLVLPDNPPEISIDLDRAINLMHQNNYMILEKMQSVSEAEMNLDRIRKSNRLSAGVSASVGYNQEAEKLPDAYKNPMRRDVVSVSISVPLLDWGVRKGQKNQAANTLDIAKIEQAQKMDELEQNVINSIGELQTRYALLTTAVEALTLARDVYDQNVLNFQNGSCDITTLSASQSRLQSAQNQYITTMSDYWSCYYDIRSQTLFDFINNSPLNIDAAYGDVGF